ncbi:MAG: tRNA lysidine(34) synthetase TilS [Armatimonadota bacterium]|nr:tRNA lysidine(34) synthetase TilS [Armatimonadota bacterium]MDR7474603.1 tRNA lysidine(34) synthetase TilS [Armatimonadota bacterium]
MGPEGGSSIFLRDTTDLLRENVEATIRRHRLLTPGDGVVTGVSGGADSVALLLLLREVGAVLHLRLVVAHLNHGLRPDAATDARFVQALAAAWGLPYVGETADVRAFARRQHLSLEAAAREVRYAFLQRVAAAHGCGVVAVGHTADDQVETLLLRLLRGGRPGGMWPRRALGAVVLVRPLLDCWRRDLRALLTERGIPWREDPTNLDRRHLRNRVRHDLLPALAGYIPDGQNKVKHSADLLAAEDAALTAAAAAVEAEALVLGEDGVRVRRAVLAAQPPAVGWRLLRRAVAACGGNLRQLRFVTVREALRLAEEGREGQRLSLPRVELEVRGDDLLLVPAGSPPWEEVVLPVAGRVDAKPFGLIVESTILPREAMDLGDGAAYLDADRVRLPLMLRPWRPGDRFTPLGMRGRKKVGDFLTDAKVPRLHRRRLPVLVDGAGTILWLVGWRLAEEARVTGQTQRVLRLRVRPRA